MIQVQSIEEYKSDKIIDFDECIKLISQFKSEKKSVGLCHGGLDLLHPGHIKHFESARKLCDVLVVSITADEFVSCRKGSGRPIFTDKLRAYAVANLSCVDYVVISNFKTGVEVINLLKPSIYVKGPDFINKTTPGITAERNAIKDVGGEIKYTDDPTLSTTAIIQHIKDIETKDVLVVVDRDGTLIKNNDFLGKNEDWKNEIEFNDEVVNFLSSLQTKYRTTKIVVTNQAGVARKLFDCQRVEEINNYIDSVLASKGVKISFWKYCPDVDAAYAELKKDEIDFDSSFVKDQTKRKPSTELVLDALKELNKSLDDFNEIIVIGDREEDKELSDNLNAQFIDINNNAFLHNNAPFIFMKINKR